MFLTEIADTTYMSNPTPTTAAPATTVLDTVRDLITKYVALPTEGIADILSLFAVHTHAFTAARTTPYIYVTSQGPGSGKTRLLEVMIEICKGGNMQAGLTGPTLFRMIEARKPTLFLDEVDAIYSGAKNEELRGVLNSGYKHNGSIARVDQTSEDGFRDYSTFCPKILAGIDNGQVPSTVMDRSIVIRMVKTVGTVAPFYSEDVEEIAEEIMEEIGTWVAANMDRLKDRTRRPAAIEGLSDRQNDIIRPLLTIADAFGGDWPTRARLAFLSAFAAEETPLTPQAQMLSVIRDEMIGHGLDKITTARIEELTGQNGKQIGAWLAAFNITPGTYRGFHAPESRATGQDPTKAKGYKRDAAMEAAWDRYLPALPAQVNA